MENKIKVYCVAKGESDSIGSTSGNLPEGYRADSGVVGYCTDLRLDGVYVRQWGGADNTDMPITHSILHARKAEWVTTQNDRLIRITDNEYRQIADEYTAVMAARKSAEIQAEIDEALAIVAEGDAIMARTGKPLPTRDEVSVWRGRYNDINNEGGEGFIPSLLTRESYDYYKGKVVANG